MKVKHFAGYGSVEVKKESKTTFTNEYGEKKTKLALVVKGNHEWGIVRDDLYDVKRWIFEWQHIHSSINKHQQTIKI